MRGDSIWKRGEFLSRRLGSRTSNKSQGKENLPLKKRKSPFLFEGKLAESAGSSRRGALPKGSPLRVRNPLLRYEGGVHFIQRRRKIFATRGEGKEFQPSGGPASGEKAKESIFLVRREVLFYEKSSTN